MTLPSRSLAPLFSSRLAICFSQQAASAVPPPAASAARSVDTELRGCGLRGEGRGIVGEFGRDGDRGNGPPRRHSGDLSEALRSSQHRRLISECRPTPKKWPWRWPAPRAFSVTIKRRCLREPCASSAASIFRPESITPATRRCTGSRIPIAAARSTPSTFPARSFRPRDRSTACNRGSAFSPAKRISMTAIPAAVNPGGVPLFKQGVMVGGVGVAGVPPDVAEFAAFSGAVGAGFGANPAPPGVVIINGIALPFVNQTTMPAGYAPGSADGGYALGPLGSPKAAARRRSGGAARGPGGRAHAR